MPFDLGLLYAISQVCPSRQWAVPHAKKPGVQPLTPKVQEPFPLGLFIHMSATLKSRLVSLFIAYRAWVGGFLTPSFLSRGRMVTSRPNSRVSIEPLPPEDKRLAG